MQLKCSTCRGTGYALTSNGPMRCYACTMPPQAGSSATLLSLLPELVQALTRAANAYAAQCERQAEAAPRRTP